MGTRIKTNKDQNSGGLKFKEVKTVFSESEANELIKKGWSLMHVGLSHIDGAGFNAKPTYMMAK